MTIDRKAAGLLAASASLCALLSASAASAATQLNLVEVLTNPSRTELLNAQLAEFSKENPDIKVNLISLPYESSFEKLLAMYKTGQAPDVVELADRWGGLYVRNKQLEPLDAYIAKTPELSQLQPRVFEIGKVGTKQTYVLPYGFLMRAVYYNVDLLKQAGVEPPKTFDDIFSVAATVTTKVPGKFGYCLRAGKGGGMDWGFFPMQYGPNGAFFDAEGNSNYGKPGFHEGMEKYADLYRKGSAPKESISWGYGDSVAGFTSEQCALLDQDPDALADITRKMAPEKFQVIPVPTGPGGKAYTSIGYFSWAMSSASKNKDDAWKLLSFLMAHKQNIAFDKAQFMIPAYQGADKDPFYATPQWAAWLTMLQKPEVYHTWTQPAYLAAWGPLYDKTMVEDGQAIMLGKKDVKSVAESWASILTPAQKRYLADQ